LKNKYIATLKIMLTPENLAKSSVKCG